jgi:hypothetical protein
MYHCLGKRITDNLVQSSRRFRLYFQESPLRHAPDAKVSFVRVIFSNRDFFLVIRFNKLQLG